jgi:kanamycin kinase
MKKTIVTLNHESLPASVREFLYGASIYDSSSSNAQTYFIDSKQPIFLKISKIGSLKSEYNMTQFLHTHHMAPKALLYVSDEENDYLVTEAIHGEDGIENIHIVNPKKLVSVFGEYLRMLHSLPTDGCPYPDKTTDYLNEASERGIDTSSLNEIHYTPNDNVVIHGDYCLPNIIMENFSFKGFIDLGEGGIGDRHHDLYWGLWTLNYNLKTEDYHDTFLDAYGRKDIDPVGLNYFTKLNEVMN